LNQSSYCVAIISSCYELKITWGPFSDHSSLGINILNKILVHPFHGFLTKFLVRKDTSLPKIQPASIANKKAIGHINAPEKRYKKNLSALFVEDIDPKWWDLFYCAPNEEVDGNVIFLYPSEFSEDES
jgi:hypothetical protein